MKRLNFYEKFFQEYTAAFKGTAEQVHGFAIKKRHTMDVYRHAERIAGSLQPDNDDYCAAMVAALFHDIGRFEQFKHYGTYVDRDSLNHASHGVRVLKELELLDDFSRAQKKNILAAIACHNCPILPERLPEKAALYCRIVRDADKLDIFRVVIEVYESGKHDPVILLNLDNCDTITPDIYQSVLDGKVVPYHKMKTTADFKMVQLGWFSELYFSESYRIAREKQYAEKIINSLPDTPEVKRVERQVLNIIGKKAA